MQRIATSRPTEPTDTPAWREAMDERRWDPWEQDYDYPDND